MNERIKAIRKESGLNQTEFAEKLNLSRNFIAQVETSSRTVSDRTIADICRVFNVNEEWLREGTGEMFRRKSPREEMAAWVAEINKLPTTSAQRRIAHMLTLLDPDDWITIDKMIRVLKEGE